MRAPYPGLWSPPPSPPAPVPFVRTVLLVDDDPTFLRAARRFLEDAGFEIVGAAKGAAEGAMLAGRLQPDVVLLDLAMPGTDGFAAVPVVRAAAPAAAVVVVSTHEAGGYRDRALALGVDGYIPKSRLVDDLVPLLRRPALAGPTDRRTPPPQTHGA